MDALEPKKLALLRILQILEKYSDCEHPLTQENIANKLNYDYGIIVERKAIGRNISLLKEAGFDIEATRAGCYLATREFERSELKLLIDSVLSSKHITARHSRDLIEKLCGLESKYFRAFIKNIHSVNGWSKTDNQALFYNIEVIDNAIEEGKQISFDYNKYGADKTLHKTATHTVSPYQLLLHNQRYYLMALNERWQHMGYYRVDRITDMRINEEKLTPVNSVAGFENGVNYAELATSLPYMYTDKPEQIVFLAEEHIADQLIDWFGSNIKIDKENDLLRVSVKTSPRAMEFWAMQYLNYVEVLKPQSLRDKIKDNVIKAQEKYK